MRRRRNPMLAYLDDYLSASASFPSAAAHTFGSVTQRAHAGGKDGAADPQSSAGPVHAPAATPARRSVRSEPTEPRQFRESNSARPHACDGGSGAA